MISCLQAFFSCMDAAFRSPRLPLLSNLARFIGCFFWLFLLAVSVGCFFGYLYVLLWLPLGFGSTFWTLPILCWSKTPRSGLVWETLEANPSEASLLRMEKASFLSLRLQFPSSEGIEVLEIFLLVNCYGTLYLPIQRAIFFSKSKKFQNFL